jgi:glycosyltransferase involved in cell wall biosynthesis
MTATAARPNGARVLLMLPCFNEGRAISELLAEVRALGEEFDALVVDDGSDDDTYEVASAQAATIRLPLNLGIGGAVHTAIRYADEHGYGFGVQIDGDGQHPPDQVRRLLEAFRRKPTNLTIGSRYLGGATYQSTFLRRCGIRLIGGWVQLLYGVRVTDPTSGMRLFDREALRFFAQSYPHDFPEPISLALALRQGLTVQETPVSMRERVYGSSSIKGLKVLAYMVRVLCYILLSRLGRRT